MKHLISYCALAFCLTLTSFAKAQKAIDKYCLLINQSPAKSVEAKTSFKLYVGTEDSLFSFKDPTLLGQLKKVEGKTSLVDALNYLSRLGWQYIGLSSTVNNGGGFGNAIIGQQYLFKRTFDQSELK